jgi:DNA adenine methylase
MLEEKRSVVGSALFIFLNKTCFRGMYRTGPKGFNVPFGSYKNPEIVNLEHLTEVAVLIKDVIFEVADFSLSMERAEPGDFLYLDPPYVPETSSSFVGYNREGFSEEQHKLLFNLCESVKARGVQIVMSNSNTAFVRNSVGSAEVITITCKRSINSKNPGSKTEEVLVKF